MYISLFNNATSGATMIRKPVVGLTLCMIAVPLLADKALDNRMMHAASILQEIRGSLDEEAPGVLNGTYAVAIFPEFVKVGLLGAVKHGRGVLATRLDNGDWSKPAFVRLTSGSLGLQFGVSMSQLLIVFKDPKAVDAISGGQFTIGADVGYAAGGLGGATGASTDNKFQNQIVALARSKGLFAGVGLEGGILRIERDSNVEFYNNAIGLDGRRLLEDTEVELPAVAQHFRIVVQESVPSLPEEEQSVSADNSGAGASAPDNSGISTGLPGQPSSGARSPAQSNSANASATAPKGAERTLNKQPVASASPAPTQQKVTEGAWINPEQTSASGDPSADARSSGNSRLADELASRASGALWDGAVDLASNALRDDRDTQKAKLAAKTGGRLAGRAGAALLDGAADLAGHALRNDRDVQNVKLAAKTGSKLAKAAIHSSSPGAPSPARGSVAPTPSATNGAGQWVSIDPAREQVASNLPQPVDKSVISAPAAPAVPPANTAEPGFTGPPAPSEWPQEWLQQQAAKGACAPGS